MIRRISKISMAVLISGSLFGMLSSAHAKSSRYGDKDLNSKRAKANNKYLKRINNKYKHKYGVDLVKDAPADLNDEDLLIATEELGKDFIKLKRETDGLKGNQDATNAIRKIGLSLSKELKNRTDSGNFIESSFTYNKADGTNTGI